METQERKMTIPELLTEISNDLGNLKIPVGELESIGIPVARAINGIKLCIDALGNTKQAEEKETAEGTGDENA